MRIWYNKELTIEDFKSFGKGTMAEYIGIEWIEAGEDFLKARMPVDHRTNQPYGLLHGGASCTLAETIGSVASAMVVDHSKFVCVGLEINANHIKGVRSGFVYGKATALHIGRTTQVWEIRITNEAGELVCISRITMAVIEKK